MALRTLVRKFKRWVYTFDGVDDRGVLAYRAINPDGDIDIEFRTGPTIPTAGTSWTVIAQNVSATSVNREFGLYTNNSNVLQLMIGGLFSSNMGEPLEPNKTYRVTLNGTALTFYKNGNIILSTSFTRGSAREPSAFTVVAARNTAVSSWGSYYQGQIYDLKINGVLYPLSDADHTIQLPSPSMLGAELMPPAGTCHLKGAHWTYLGGGRWQYVGDGSYNELVFVDPILQPQSWIVEFEVESITGVMRVYTATSNVGVYQSNPIFSSPGKYRHFVTSRNGVAPGTYFSFIRNNTGQVASCIIKNISFKPLVSGYGSEMVANGDFNSATGWTLTAGATISNGELNINSAVVCTTTQPIATLNDRTYEVSYTIKSISAGSVRAILYGRGMQYVGPSRNSVGVFTEIVRFNAAGGSFTNTISIQGGHASNTVVVVDDVSVREVLGFCNPLTLTNTASTGWQEIDT